MGVLSKYFGQLQRGVEIDPSILSVLNFKRGLRVDDGVQFDGFIYLPWIERGMSHCKVLAGDDVLSTKFTGCYFAKVWNMDNSMVAFHIDTLGANIRTNWNSYVDSSTDIKNVTLFRPDDVGNHGSFELWAIISCMEECMALVVSPEIEPNEETGRLEYTKVVFERMIPMRSLGENI